MLNSDPLAAAQLKSQEANTSFVISPEEAHNFGEVFRKHGSDVTDSELSGSTVNAAWIADRNGDLAPVMVATKKGQKIAEMDLREKDYGRSQRGIKRGGNGWQGTFAGYHFISGERRDMKGPDGDLVRIHGVTADGHIVDLIGTTSGGKEQVVTKTIKQGPKYEGTLFMAADANVPVEVFRDTAAGAIFAQAYSKELSNVYQGKLSKEDALRVIYQAGGNLRLNLGLGGVGGGVGGAKTKMDMSINSQTSATDVITQAAMAINRSDMSIRQKEQAYQELTRMLISVKRERPEDLPEAVTMVHDGGNPFGEIRNTQDNRGGLEKLKDTIMGKDDD